jgi:hypothetical protein
VTTDRNIIAKVIDRIVGGLFSNILISYCLVIVIAGWWNRFYNNGKFINKQFDSSVKATLLEREALPPMIQSWTWEE